MRPILPFLALVLLLAACGEPRRFGDAGGVPVTVNVTVDRSFVGSMENRQARPGVGGGVGFGSGGYSGVGVGVGLSFSSTQIYLVGGDNVGQANIFRQELKWGDNTFTVPLTSGRMLHLSVHAEGGRRGWEAIGPVLVPNAGDPRVAITLDETGAKIEVTPAVAPAPATTPAPAAPPAPPPPQPAP
jgi:hypothetical protein